MKFINCIIIRKFIYYYSKCLIATNLHQASTGVTLSVWLSHFWIYSTCTHQISRDFMLLEIGHYYLELKKRYVWSFNAQMKISNRVALSNCYLVVEMTVLSVKCLWWNDQCFDTLWTDNRNLSIPLKWWDLNYVFLEALTQILLTAGKEMDYSV